VDTRQLQAALQRFSGARVGVIGDIMADKFIYGPANRLSPEAPVPVVFVEKQILKLGGAANVAHNIATMHGNARMFGAVGDDETGNSLLAEMQEKSIATTGVVRMQRRGTTLKTRIVAQSQHIVRFDVEDPSPLPDTERQELIDHFEHAASALDLLIVSDYDKGIWTEHVAAGVMAACRAHSIPVFIDPKPENVHLCQGAEVIKPNLGEALGLAGRLRTAAPDEMQTVCNEVRRKSGAKNVVVTAGSSGIYILEEDNFVHLPGIAREVYDVAGAGDSTLAGMALALSSGLGLVDAARIGNAAGAVAVSKLGITAVTNSELVQAVKDIYGGT
jgi:D-beta-D-heptose 7-phosphate kinase/D-beta-D-heptose 1-phosphate adenosyltransferase